MRLCLIHFLVGAYNLIANGAITSEISRDIVKIGSRNHHIAFVVSEKRFLMKSFDHQRGFWS